MTTPNPAAEVPVQLIREINRHVWLLKDEQTALEKVAESGETIAKARNLIYPLMNPLNHLLDNDALDQATTMRKEAREELHAVLTNLETSYNALNEALNILNRR
jgi:Mg2+ and Co2+ transporter CorA